MPARQFRADCSKSLLVLNPEQVPSSQDNFSTSGVYIPDFNLIDGKNILPSTTGYFSYFGVDIDFNDAITEDIQDVVTFRTNYGDTLFIAMTPEGLYIKSILGAATPSVVYTPYTPSTDPNDSPRLRHLIGYTDVTMPGGKCEWTVVATAPLGSPNPWSLWTWAIVNNDLYFYQQGLGYVVHIYGHEKGIVRIDQLEPFYIIGSIPQFRWTISGVDSNYSCTDTTKSIEIPGLGTFPVYNLDKAHYVKYVKEQWQGGILGFSGLGLNVEVTSQSQQDLIGSVAVDFDCPEGSEGGMDYTCMSPPLLSYTDPELVQIDYYTSCRQTAGILSAGWYFTSRSYGVDFANSKGLFLSYTWNEAFQNITISFFSTPLVAANYVPIDLPAPDRTQVVDLSAYSFNDDNQRMFVFPGTDWALYFFTTYNEPGWDAAKIAVWVNLLTGATSEFVRTPFNFAGDANSFVFELSEATYDAINNKYYIVTRVTNSVIGYTFGGVRETSPLESISGADLRDTGQYITSTTTNTPGSQSNSLITLAKSGAFLATWSGFGALVDATGTLVSTYQGMPASTFDNIQTLLDTGTEILGYMALDYSNGGQPNKKYMSWVRIPNNLSTIINATYFESIKSGVLVETGSEGGPVYQPYVGYTSVDSSVYVTGVAGAYWTTYGGNTYLVQSGTNPYLFNSARGIFVLQGDFAEIPPTPTPPCPGRAAISLTHDGQPSELTSSWNSSTDTLTVGGFKEFGLTGVTINAGGIPVRDFTVSALMDSNDLWDKLLLEIAAAFPTYTFTPTLSASAQADIGYNVVLSYVDFDQVTPVPVLAHDGDCTWTLSNTETAPLDLAQVSGITSARGRLVAWDRLNAIYTSSNQDPLDFTPDIATQANVGSVQAVQGNVVMCLGWNDGFIIYSTGNVVRAKYTGGTYTFDYNAISDSGAIDPRHITGNLDSQFIWTNKGLLSVNVTNGEVSEVAPELTDWLNQHRYPIKMNYMGDRYMSMSLLVRPPGVFQPEQRSTGTATDYRKGHASYIPRQPFLAGLQTFPFGSNLFGTYQIGLLYDTVLQKWGNASLPYKTLFSVNPINAKGFPSEKSPQSDEDYYHNRIRSLAGILEDSSTVLFNDAPTDAYVCYGHSKFDVHMWSTMIKTVVEYVDYPEAVIQLEPSWDGRTVNWDKVATSSQGTTPIQSFATDLPCDWTNITIRGVFHVRSITLRGIVHADI